jgi:hypothetical protein
MKMGEFFLKYSKQRTKSAYDAVTYAMLEKRQDVEIQLVRKPVPGVSLR